MMKAKRLTAIALAAAIMITNAMPTQADIISKKTVADTTMIYTDNAHNIEYPCWIWISGYAYYYQNAAMILKNTTTPDGYTVDDQGRWIVNGVPQTNGYGNHIMGTSDYNGKSNDEIWSSLVSKLEPVYINGISTGEINLMISPRELSYDSSKYTYGSDISIWKDIDNYDVVKKDYFKAFITARIGNSWSDNIKDTPRAWIKMAYADSAEMKEKTIKAVVGDVVGKELFDYIRRHADQISHSGGYTIAIDENGNTINGWIHGGFMERPATKENFIEDWREEIEYRKANNVKMDYPVPDLENLPEPEPYGEYDLWFNDPNGRDTKSIWIQDISDGINPKALDLSQWQNRTTDYGKRFRVSNDEGVIVIYVYD